MDPSPSPSPEFLLNAFCTRCGYDLRSNNVAGPCPKCGLELTYASVNSELRGANPMWLQRVALGIAALAVTQLLLAVERSWNLLVLLSNADGRRSFAWMQFSDMALGIEWFSILYLLTGRQSEHQHQEEWTSGRTVLRVVCGAWVIAHVFYRIWRYTLLRATGGYVNAAWFLLTALHVAAIALLFSFLMRLARRTGQPLFRHHFPIALTLTLISLGFSFLISLSEIVDMPRISGRVGYLQYLISIAAEVYFLWLLRHLKKAIDAALATESAGDSPHVASQ